MKVLPYTCKRADPKSSHPGTPGARHRILQATCTTSTIHLSFHNVKFPKHESSSKSKPPSPAKFSTGNASNFQYKLHQFPVEIHPHFQCKFKQFPVQILAERAQEGGAMLHFRGGWGAGSLPPQDSSLQRFHAILAP